MKKLFSILLLMAYVSTTPGIQLQLHYCCGKLERIELGSMAGNAAKADKPGFNNCCAFQQVLTSITAIKEPDELLSVLRMAAQVNFIDSTGAAVTNLSPGIIFLYHLYSQAHLCYPLFLVNCVFRI